MNAHRDVWIVLLLTAVMAATLYASQQYQSVSYDEPELLYSGLRAWKQGDYSASPHPPLTKLLGALPVLPLEFQMPPDRIDTTPPEKRPAVRTAWDEAKRLLFDTPGLDPVDAIRRARIPTIFLWVVLVLATWAWARELYGVRGGLLVFGLVATCPVTLASAQILSTDMGGVAFSTLGLYLASRAAQRPTIGRFCAAGVAFGLALGSRYQPLATTGAAVGLLGLLALWRRDADDERAMAPTLELRQAITGSTALLFSAFATLLVLYRGTSILHFPESIAFLSKSIGPLQAFWFTIDGEVSQTGWFSYFPRVLAYKLPPGHLLLLIAGLGSLAALRPRRAEWLVVLPSLALFALAVHSRINYGVRHVLPVIPPLYILAARLTEGRPRVALALLLIPLAGAIDVARTYPDFQPYVSPLFGGTDEGWRRLGDSSIDTGQGLIQLRTQLAGEGALLAYFGTADPVHYGIRYRYLFGQHDRQRLARETRDLDFPPKHLAVSVCFVHLTGLYGTPGAFHWLRETPPDRTAGHAILIWNLEQRPQWYGRLTMVYLESSLSAYWSMRNQERLRSRAAGLLRRARVQSPDSLPATLAWLDTRAAALGPQAGAELVFLFAATLHRADFPRERAIALFTRLLDGDYGELPPQHRQAAIVNLQRLGVRWRGSGSGSGSGSGPGS